VSPLLERATTSGPQTAVVLALRVVGVVLLYLGWHALAERFVPTGTDAPSVVGWYLAGLGFVGLFTAKAALQLRPDGRFARTLHPWLFAGLYLDELFTRLTFRVWPPNLAKQRPGTFRAIQAPATLEAQT
jgi:NAD(P)H-quinone oxidoreductase subunit 5